MVLLSSSLKQPICVFENGKMLQSYGKSQGGKPITIGYNPTNQQYFSFSNKGSNNSGSIYDAISGSTQGKYSSDFLQSIACPIVPKEPLNPPSPSTPQPKPLSPAELSGAKFLLATLTADKQASQAKQQQYYQNILQIAGQNMRDAAAKQLARDESRMQQAYAVGGETYIPLKRVEPGGQAKSLNDVWQNSLSGLIDPTYGGNLPLAAWSTVGDLIDCGMQQVVHQISTVEGGSQTLAVVGYIPNKLIATVKDFSKDIAKKYLPKEYYQNLSEFYHGLPDNTKVTLNLFTDGLILQGAGSALKIGLTSPVPAAIQHIPHKPGISTTPSAMLAFEGGSSNPLFAIKGTTSGIGEISATSGVGKISVDTGATFSKNILAKPMALEVKPTTSSVVAKVEHKLPAFDKVKMPEVAMPELGESSIASYSPNYKYFSEPVEWTSPIGTRQTYKIYQRIDIDWDMVRTKGPDKFIGKTNKEAALVGHTPQLSDGNFINLHHIGQNSKGPLAEVSTKIHSRANKQAFKALHNQFECKGHPEFPVDHGSKWQSDVKNYWKWRANNAK